MSKKHRLDNHEGKYYIFKILKDKESINIMEVSLDEIAANYMMLANYDDFKNAKQTVEVLLSRMISDNYIKRRKRGIYTFHYTHKNNTNKGPQNRVNWVWDLLQKQAYRRGWKT